MTQSGTHEASAPRATHLSRTLGLWAIVALGLGYMTPTVIFDTFGIVSSETNGGVPSAYSRTMSPNLGFIIGWSSLLDYILLPLVNALIIRSYLESFFPNVSPWIWVVVYVAAITAMCLFSMSNTSRVNGLLVVFEVVLIAVFIVLAWRALSAGDGNGTIFSTTPAWHANVELSHVITGATLVCFLFIGFDAITM